MSIEPMRWFNFPNLRDDAYYKTSESSIDYNCVAWIFGDTENWWEPAPEEETAAYWPPGILRESSLASYLELFASSGYAPCENGSFETGFTKIAIYWNPQEREFNHVAKQIDGRWSSKIGPWEDITHVTLESLEGYLYGAVYQILRMRQI